MCIFWAPQRSSSSKSKLCRFVERCSVPQRESFPLTLRTSCPCIRVSVQFQIGHHRFFSCRLAVQLHSSALFTRDHISLEMWSTDCKNKGSEAWLRRWSCLFLKRGPRCGCRQTGSLVETTRLVCDCKRSEHCPLRPPTCSWIKVSSYSEYGFVSSVLMWDYNAIGPSCVV